MLCQSMSRGLRSALTQVSSWMPQEPALRQLAPMRIDSRGPKIVKAHNLIRTWKLQTGDEVKVISGKDKTKVGEIIATDYRRNMVKVKGCNLRKIRVPMEEGGKEGDYMQIEKKIHYSNVALLDPVEQVPTKVKLQFMPDGKVIRISKLTGHIIPWPDASEEPPTDAIEGPKDTPPDKALEKTYDYAVDQEAVRLARLALTKYNRNFG
mmetsp:Transcript_43823/g.80025  ORF Transcript_43823/g.80025 Transcript_43823/m.80025 type:complete len:208 (-) Transcript_43823:76-699(-)